MRGVGRRTGRPSSRDVTCPRDVVMSQQHVCNLPPALSFFIDLGSSQPDRSSALGADRSTLVTRPAVGGVFRSSLFRAARRVSSLPATRAPPDAPLVASPPLPRARLSRRAGLPLPRLASASGVRRSDPALGARQRGDESRTRPRRHRRASRGPPPSVAMTLAHGGGDKVRDDRDANATRPSRSPRVRDRRPPPRGPGPLRARHPRTPSSLSPTRPVVRSPPVPPPPARRVSARVRDPPRSRPPRRGPESPARNPASVPGPPRAGTARPRAGPTPPPRAPPSIPSHDEHGARLRHPSADECVHTFYPNKISTRRSSGVLIREKTLTPPHPTSPSPR